MGVSAAIALGGLAAGSALSAKPPAVPEVPEPPRITDEQRRKAETEAVSRQRAQAAASAGGRSTILTGPLGLVGDPTVRRATLLGG